MKEPRARSWLVTRNEQAVEWKTNPNGNVADSSYNINGGNPPPR